MVTNASESDEAKKAQPEKIEPSVVVLLDHNHGTLYRPLQAIV